MKEEELIKKLESVELPEIEPQSHRRRLRMALLQSEYFKEYPKMGVFSLAKSKIKGGIDTMIRGLVSKQPVWRTVVISVLAVALITGLVITLPSLTGQSAEALAADIARNSPEVQAALGGGEVEIVKVILLDDKGEVVCRGETGQIVTAKVDLGLKLVETLHTSQLTEAEKEKAITIVKADPRVQEILAQGATIYKVSSMFHYGTMVTQAGEVEEFFRALALVAIGFDPSDVHEKHWSVMVDLDKERVVDIIIKEPAKTKTKETPEGKVEYLEIEK